MTLKEEAKELVDNLKDGLWKDRGVSIHSEDAIYCALIAVDFAMNSKYSFQPMHGGWVSGKLYYEELKQEIEKL